MAIPGYIDSLRDVQRYPTALLKRHEHGVEVYATYRRVWDDEFGARGWKLNAAIDEPEIIASTRQTGERINTSVFVHDILDHLISGFGMSGHRSEAMALAQLALRTGSDPGPDYRQMVVEDIMNGRVNGETMSAFLPQGMLSLLPVDKTLSDGEIISYLAQVMGKDALQNTLVDYFFILGDEGCSHAAKSWNILGLVHDNAANTGIALQSLLDKVDFEAEESRIESLDASIILNTSDCLFVTTAGHNDSRRVYRADIINKVSE